MEMHVNSLNTLNGCVCLKAGEREREREKEIGRENEKSK